MLERNILLMYKVTYMVTFDVYVLAVFIFVTFIGFVNCAAIVDVARSRRDAGGNYFVLFHLL